MTTTIPTTDLPAGPLLVQQLIDAVTAHPEVREPLLRALLTEDFLTLPDRVSRLQSSFDDFRAETQDEFRRVNARIDANTGAIAEHTDAIAVNTGTIAANTGAIAEHSQTIAEHSRIIAENSRVIAELSQNVAENNRRTRQMEGHVGRLRGAAYEDLCRYAIAAILDGMVRAAVLADRERINEQLLEARGDGLITRDEYLDGLYADIIARDKADEDHADLLLVGECSITFNRNDLETASRRAGIIGKVTGVRTQAFLATHYGDWPEDISEVARQLNVAVIHHQSPDHVDE